MSKKKPPTDLDAGMAPEKVPAPGREPKDTDRDWLMEKPPGLVSGQALPLVPPPGEPVSEAGGVEPEPLPPAAAAFIHALGERDGDAVRLLVELEARCAAGGSAGLADIRAVLKVLRGG